MTMPMPRGDSIRLINHQEILNAFQVARCTVKLFIEHLFISSGHELASLYSGYAKYASDVLLLREAVYEEFAQVQFRDGASGRFVLEHLKFR